jgi:hypothetical protein
MRSMAAVLLISAAGWGCASSKNPSPAVPVAGDRSDVSALAGRWEGEYESEATGRSGSIVFELKPGDRVARGDVLMVPKGALGKEAPPPSNLPGGSDPSRTMPQVLSISFVSASGGVLTGTMNPYKDPQCDCEVQTTFVGRLSGDEISGTFTSMPAGAAPITTGRWKMTRKKP